MLARNLWIFSAIPIIPAQLTTTWILPCKLYLKPRSYKHSWKYCSENNFLAAYSFITLKSNTKLNNLKLKVNVNGLTRIHTSFFFFPFWFFKQCTFLFQCDSFVFCCGTELYSTKVMPTGKKTKRWCRTDSRASWDCL